MPQRALVLFIKWTPSVESFLLALSLPSSLSSAKYDSLQVRLSSTVQQSPSLWHGHPVCQCVCHPISGSFSWTCGKRFVWWPLHYVARGLITSETIDVFQPVCSSTPPPPTPACLLSSYHHAPYAKPASKRNKEANDSLAGLKDWKSCHGECWRSVE